MAPAKQPELKQSASPQEHYRHTAVRLARIKSHLETAPRTGKLEGKVAIVTGAGSLKGIGYTFSNASKLVILTCFLAEPLRCPLPMQVGRLLPVQWSNDSEYFHRRATSLPHGLVWGEPPWSEVDYRGAVSRRDSADTELVASHGVVLTNPRRSLLFKPTPLTKKRSQMSATGHSENKAD
jgi:hypothetical protein